MPRIYRYDLASLGLVEHPKRDGLAVGNSRKSHYVAGVGGAGLHFVFEVEPQFRIGVFKGF